MSNYFQENEIIQVTENKQEGPYDLFKQILDRPVDLCYFEQFLDVCSHKRSGCQKFYDQQDENNCFFNIEAKPQIQSTKKQELCFNEGVKQLEVASEKHHNANYQALQIKKQNSYQSKSYQRNRRTTRCSSRLEGTQIQMNNQWKHPTDIVAQFNCPQQQLNGCQTELKDKKYVKTMRKLGKFIFKEKCLGKSFKISFPKKIVQMFINHFQEYLEQDNQIFKYNDRLKLKLKQNKKNDYTFQKQISQILGESKQQNSTKQSNNKQVSAENRLIFSQIIRDTMKQQVIMRDKIAKNRELYMLQLKVYALRCRSHKLSKKGTFK